MADRPYLPPKSVGEPYRADPTDAAPFLTENDKVPTVPVETTPLVESPGSPGPPYGHPPSHSPEHAGTQPVFRAPTPAATQTPEERFAKTAFWVSIASIFIFNVVLGPIAILMGVIAWRRGEKKLGRLAVVFGAIGLIIGIAFLVLVAQGVLPSVDEMLDDIRKGR